MARESARSGIDRGSSRQLFSELLSVALRELGSRPSPMAVAYLLELLDARLKRPEAQAETQRPPSFAETLLQARLQAGAVRVRRLRDLGDRALFESGLFGGRRLPARVDPDYTDRIGRVAYAELSACLASRSGGGSWPRLFRELSDDFSAFVDVLAQIGDCACPGAGPDLLRTCDRFARTGSERDRRRLLGAGVIPPTADRLGRRH